MTSIETLRQLGGIVRQARRDAGLTQAKLAQSAGLSRYTVIRLETGNLADINYKTLVTILSVLELQLAVGERPVSGLPVLGSQR